MNITYVLYDTEYKKLIQFLNIGSQIDGKISSTSFYDVDSLVSYLKENGLNNYSVFLEYENDFSISYQTLDTHSSIISNNSARNNYEKCGMDEQKAVAAAQDLKIFSGNKKELTIFLTWLDTIGFEFVDALSIMSVDIDRLKNDVTYDPLNDFSMPLGNVANQQKFKSRFRIKHK